MVALLGQRDELLKLVEAAFDSEIVVRGNEITIAGPEVEVERVALLFEELITLLERGHELNASSVGRSIELIKGEEATPTQVLGDVFLTGRGRGIAPKTLGQKRYVDAMRSGTVTFAIGPAGTGKTYLAVATAVRALEQKQVSRLILTRPGRRGRRAPRVPAGDAVREDRPVHEAAVRRAVRDDGRRRAAAPHGTRDRRGRAPRVSCGEER